MITNPSCGWCTFKVGEFIGNPSYVTSVPIDLLDCFLEYFWRGSSSVYFDEEGTDFTFVISDIESFIIKNDETPTLYRTDIIPEKLGVELLKDLEGNENKWIDDFFIEQDENERVRLYNELINKVALLRNKLYQRKYVDKKSDLEINYQYCIRPNMQLREEREEEDNEN